MNQIKFTPLKFLAALGAGGIAVSPFALMQYSVHTGKGLINISHIDYLNQGPAGKVYFGILFSIMLVFTFLHLFLLASYGLQYRQYRKSTAYREILADPVRNSNLLAPFIALIMALNVFIGPIRFFIPALAVNLQLFMAPALVIWLTIWFFLMRTEIRLLKISFSQFFDMNKLSFGWLLHAFALAMASVTGSGIAAMSKNLLVAKTAAFFTTVTLVMGIFLFLVKTVSLFKVHFQKDQLPEKQSLPGFLIVIPVMTLFSITGFRLVHFMEVVYGFHVDFLAYMIVVGGFAFEVWYGIFGLALLKDYFRRSFFQEEFYVSQWGLVCPVVAFGVLGSFFHKLFQPGAWFAYVVFAVILTAAGLFFFLLQRANRCRRKSAAGNAYLCLE